MEENSHNIVISGISGRFPQNDNVEQLKYKLYNQTDMVSDSPRWPNNIFDLSKRMGKINSIDKFDAQYFGINGIQANNMDPQLRILLELSIEAIFDSGSPPENLRGSQTAVIVGVNGSEMTETLDQSDRSSCQTLLCSSSTLFANRISYCLDLKGPSYTVSSACSSSGLALHNAVMLITSGQCDAALVGGSQICLNPMIAKQYNDMNVLSPDGSCKFMDSEANGFVRSEACVVLYIQREKNAKRIYARIKGIATNNDGFKTEGFSHPSVYSQTQLMKSNLSENNIDANNIGYIEAHGTGTKVGDTCEVSAIVDAYCMNRDETLLIGGVKTNLGHTEAASALTSIVKVVIAFQCELIPSNLHLKCINKNFDKYIERKLKPIVKNTALKDCVVSINSFGIGGANVNILLEPQRKILSVINENHNELPFLIPLFSRTSLGIIEQAEYLKNIFNRIDTQFLTLIDDVSKCNKMNYRGFLLENLLDNSTFHNQINFKGKTVKKKICYIFPGMGSQWKNCGQEIMKISAIKQSLEHSNAIVCSKFRIDLFELLLNDTNDLYKQSTQAHLAIIAIQIALVDLFTSVGIIPDLYIGHSLGELMCAYCDGCLDRKQTLEVAYWRSKLETMANVKPGMMAVVGLTWDECHSMCGDRVWPVCHNSVSLNTIGGEVKQMTELVDKLKNNVFIRHVDSCGMAYHSELMLDTKDIGIKKFDEIIESPRLRSDKWISTTVNEDYLQCRGSDMNYVSSKYIMSNILSPVLFYEAMTKLPDDLIVVEIGTHSLLQSIIKSNLSPTTPYVSVMKRNDISGNVSRILSSIGQLYSLGADPSFSALYPKVGYPVSRGTQSLSPLIQWDHSDEWFVPLYPQYFNPFKTRDNCVEINYNNKNDRKHFDHVLNGKITMSSMGYLMMIWEFTAQSIGKSYRDMSIEFSDIKFHKEVLISKENKTMFKINRLDDGQFTISNDNEIIVTGKAMCVDDFEIGMSRDFKNNYHERKISGKDYYRDLKLKGYEFGDSHRGIKFVTTDGIWAHIGSNGDMFKYISSILVLPLTNKLERSVRELIGIEKLMINPKSYFVRNEHDEILAKYDSCSQIIKSNYLFAQGLQFRRLEKQKTDHEPIIEVQKFQPYNVKLQCQDNKGAKIFIKILFDHLNSKKISNKFQYENYLNFSFSQDFRKKFIYIIHCLNYLHSKNRFVDFDINETIEQVNKILFYDESFKMMVKSTLDLIIKNSQRRKFNILVIGKYDETFSDMLKTFNNGYNIQTNISNSNDISFDMKKCNEFNLIVVIENVLKSRKQDEFYYSLMANYDCITNQTYLLIVTISQLSKVEVFILNLMNKSIEKGDSEKKIRFAEKNRFCILRERKIFNRFTLILLRKTHNIKVPNQRFLSITPFKMTRLIMMLKSALETFSTKPDGHNIWLIGNDIHQNGVVGFVNCLRLEHGGDKIRCLMFDQFNKASCKMYKKYLEKVIVNDLVMNVINEERIGTFEYCCFRENKECLEKSSLKNDYHHQNPICKQNLSNTKINELHSLFKTRVKDGIIEAFARKKLNQDQLVEIPKTIGFNREHFTIDMRHNDERISRPLRTNVKRIINFDNRKFAIIIGGLAGFAMELCIWMFERGCRYLLLLSRNRHLDNYKRFCIQHLRLLDVRVITMKADLTTTEQGYPCVGISHSFGHMGAVFNLAMVLDDKLFVNQTIKSMTRVINSKVLTTHNMDLLTRSECKKLDYFVAFSSISGGHGICGQTNYGFANSAMERICESRRRDGLPALAIQWGPIADVGYWEYSSDMEVKDVHGYKHQRVNSCLQVLDKFMQCPDTVIASYDRVNQDIATDHRNKKQTICDQVLRMLNIEKSSLLNFESSLADLGVDSITVIDVKSLLDTCGISVSLSQISKITLNELDNFN